MSKRYAVWGLDRTYKWLWVAAIAAGFKAAKERYAQGLRERAIKRGKANG